MRLTFSDSFSLQRCSWRSLALVGAAITLSGTLALGTGQAAAEPNAPTKVKATTGGNSIALTWTASTSDIPVDHYDIYRNGTYRATVTPGTGITRAQKTGTTFIDKSVTPGATYSYEVEAVDQDDDESARSAAVSATHPTSANTTPVPSITFQLNGNNDLQPFLNDYSLPEMQAWYPKLADSIAKGGYTPANNFTVSFELTSGVANASADTRIIRVNPEWLRNNKEDSGGMFLHEMTHILQGGYKGKNPTKWGTEGMADWTREFFARERKPLAQTSSNFYYQGYSQGAALINAGNRYNPNFARNLNIALNAGTYQGDYYAPDFVRQQTGRSISQLWAETGGRPMSDYSDIRGYGGRCVDIPGGDTTTGIDLRLTDCNEQFQRWAFVYDAGSRKEGVIRSDLGDKCMDVDQRNGPVQPGTAVQLWDCNPTSAQKWVAKEDGSLVNPISGLCLDAQTFNNTPRNNAPLQLWSCNNAAWQKWNEPLYNGNVVNGGGKCMDVAGFNPNNDTTIQLYDCFHNKAQEWSVMPFKTSTSSFALRSLGRCLNVPGTATAAGTRVHLWDCNSNVAQEWTRGANSSIVNPYSGKCLGPKTGSTASGTALELQVCNGSTAQRWPSTPMEMAAVVQP